MKDFPNDLLIGVVGPCAAGKTTLTENLKKAGLNARHIAQEHSYVADMWRRITNPDVLIFLDVSYQISKKRRQLDWSPEDYAEQHRRLSNAREHASLYLYTDEMTPQEVLQSVITYIAQV